MTYEPTPKTAGPFSRDGFNRLRARTLATSPTGLNTGWEDTLVPLGMALAGKAYGDAAMTDWARQWLDHHLAAGFSTEFPTEAGFRIQNSHEPHRGFFLTPYCGEWGGGMVMAALSDAGASSPYVDGITRLADHIMGGSLRLEDGLIVHGSFSRIPWVDTLYYTAAPLARAFRVTGREEYAAEAIRQCLLHAKYLLDPTTGCFFHEAHPDGGKRTPWHWARGNGWVIKTFADTLRDCPAELPGWSDCLAIYRGLATGLMRTQHSCGLWRIVPENDESHLETSGSVMIATGLAVGIVNDWLEDGSTGASVRRTLSEVETWVHGDGRLLGCQTPAGKGGWERHKLSLMGERTYGTGALLRLLAEVEPLKLL